jgi:hypothetical protein
MCGGNQLGPHYLDEPGQPVPGDDDTSRAEWIADLRTVAARCPGDPDCAGCWR